jgi:hypothetical protein
MDFMLMPERTQSTRDSITSSREFWTIDEVLVAGAKGGYDYRAYVVNWRIVHVALQDYTGQPQVSGETLSFMLERVRQRDGRIAGHFRLDPGAAVDDEEIRSRLSNTTTKQRVAIDDYYALSHYASKDRFSFTVTQYADRSRKDLSFGILSASPPQSGVSKGEP